MLRKKRQILLFFKYVCDSICMLTTAICVEFAAIYVYNAGPLKKGVIWNITIKCYFIEKGLGHLMNRHLSKWKIEDTKVVCTALHE